MSRRPKISVIIPVYNAEKYLRQCLDSVTNQTLGDIEIICVDDGSTDSSLEILREYQNKDTRVCVITQSNSTAGAARNNGMDHAKGEFLLFVDADDYLELDALRMIYGLANKNNADITIFGGKRFNELTGKVENMPWWVHTDFMPSVQPFSAMDNSAKVFQIANPMPGNKLFKASFIREHEFRFQLLPNTNDLFFVYAAISEAERICYCKEAFYNYRIGTGTSTQDKKAKNPKCFYYALNALKTRLISRGKYDTFYQSYEKFVNVICDFNFKAFSYDVLSEEERSEMLSSLLLPKPAARPLISVIIPVYNVEKYLQACLNSVVSQTLRDIEIICVNDASTDASGKILSQYAIKDSRIHIICNDKNRGLLFARKAGVTKAKGKYITFVDADDYLFPQACEQMFDAAESNDLDIAQFGVEVVNCSGVSSSNECRKKAMQPKDKALCGDELMHSFFINCENVTSVFAKLYKSELCKTVYSKISDDYCYAGEDILTFFFICLYGTKYMGFPKIKAYKYNFGLGLSGINTVSLDKYEIYCKMSDCVRYTLEYLDCHVPNAVNEAGAIAMGTRMLTDCCRMFISRVSESDKEAAAKLLKSNWEEFSFTEEIIEKNFYMSPAQLWDKYFNIPCYHKEAPAYSSGNQPKVSVIIPIYNVEKYLKECIESIITQSLKDIEIICVNDGSLDTSLSMIEEYAEKDARIAIISKRNGGLSSARNRGLEAAHGKYTYFFDGDDILLSSALEDLYYAAEKDELDMILFGAESFFESEELKRANATYIGYYDRKYIPDVLSGAELLSYYHEHSGFRASVPLQFFNTQFLVDSEVRFFEGIYNEDELFSTVILSKARRLRVITVKYYLRRVRSGSIMTGKVTHRHVEGVFISAINVLSNAGNCRNDIGAYKFLYNYGKLMLEETKQKFKKLSNEERNKLFISGNNEYKLIFDCGWAVPDDAITAININKKSVDEAALIRASVSYKIGRFVTFIPRKIRGGIRCYKEHGAKYTVWRFKEHLRNFFKKTLGKE